MRLLPRRRSGQEHTSPTGLDSSRQSSIAIEPLLEYLDATPRRVLDLGPPIAANLACYARFGAKISVADFYRFFVSRRAEVLERGEARAPFFETLLPHGGTSRFDVVFAWDLLNYLSPEENARLLQSLGELVSPGAFLHALIVDHGKLPIRPPVYTIEDDKTLRCDAPAPVRRPAPGYSEQALLRFMPHLEVERRYRLRNQKVEYLLRYR